MKPTITPISQDPEVLDTEIVSDDLVPKDHVPDQGDGQIIHEERYEVRSPEPEGKNPIGTVLRYFFLISTSSLMAVIAFILFSIWQTGSSLMDTLSRLFEQPEPEVDVRSLVVQQVQGASELTTAVFAMEAVVPTQRDRTLGGYVIGSTTLLYIGYGEVRAGVDLSDLQPQDISVSGDRISITLPPPEILDSKIDVARSTVYDYDRGFLSLGPDVAPELQDLAELRTLERIVATACQENLLMDANERAEQVVGQLLSTAGYEEVTVTTQDPLPETCPVLSSPGEISPETLSALP